DEVQALLESGPYPARNPRQNIADLQAQVASCAKGAGELERMVRQFGLETVRAYMAHVMDNGEESVRRVIDRLEDGSFTFSDEASAVHLRAEALDLGFRSSELERHAELDFYLLVGGQRLSFSVEVSRSCVEDEFRVTVFPDAVHPGVLGEIIPGLGFLYPFELPVTGSVAFELDAARELRHVAFELSGGSGTLEL
ncbi:MAG: hydantoinase B/oxoprolinase family protein, partial [Actinomycetota bacterium]